MKTIKTALIGFGGMGKQYAKMLYEKQVEGMLLTGICCRNAEGQQQIREQYPETHIYQNADEMFAHADDFDALVIVTPHTSHVELGMRAAELGKHILMDKPAGVCTQQVKELLAVVKEQKVQLGMIFNLRAYPAYQKAKELLDTHCLGELHRVVWVYNNWYRSSAYHRSSPWRSTWQGECGGLMINQCQHGFDIWNFLFGMPDSLYASLDYGRYNDFCVDDAADIQMYYANGLHGTLIAASGENPGANRLEVWGTKGKLCIENNCKITLSENEVDTTTFAKTNTEIYAAPKFVTREIPVKEDFSDCYKIVFEQFSKHLRQGTSALASGEDGLTALELANAAYLSSEFQKRIALPICDEQYVSFLNKKIEEETKLSES